MDATSIIGSILDLTCTNLTSLCKGIKSKNNVSGHCSKREINQYTIDPIVVRTLNATGSTRILNR